MGNKTFTFSLTIINICTLGKDRVLPVHLHFSLLTNECFYCTIKFYLLERFELLLGYWEMSRNSFLVSWWKWRWGCQGWTEGIMINVLGKLSPGLRHFQLPFARMTVTLAILVKMSECFFHPGHCPWEGLELTSFQCVFWHLCQRFGIILWISCWSPIKATVEKC